MGIVDGRFDLRLELGADTKTLVADRSGIKRGSDVRGRLKIAVLGKALEDSASRTKVPNLVAFAKEAGSFSHDNSILPSRRIGSRYVTAVYESPLE